MEKIIYPEVQDILEGIETEIKELQAYALKFRNDQDTTQELQTDINNLVEKYHEISVYGDL